MADNSVAGLRAVELILRTLIPREEGDQTPLVSLDSVVRQFVALISVKKIVVRLANGADARTGSYEEYFGTCRELCRVSAVQAYGNNAALTDGDDQSFVGLSRKYFSETSGIFHEDELQQIELNVYRKANAMDITITPESRLTVKDYINFFLIILLNVILWIGLMTIGAELKAIREVIEMQSINISKLTSTELGVCPVKS